MAVERNFNPAATAHDSAVLFSVPVVQPGTLEESSDKLFSSFVGIFADA